MSEIGTYMPKGEIIRGEYVGPGTGFQGCTCLMADMGEFWSVQIDYHSLGLHMYGWWKCPKEDWRPV